jgi:radical SAM protein with 4Fe4S-binding SPASM domain
MNTPEFELGDARTEGLEALQQGERNRELRQRVLDRRWAVPECATCSWRNFCQGSCAALSYMKTNDWFVNDEFCEFRRELYRRHVLRTAKQ